ncbi:MAG: 1,4-dihydroxy-2-naphthoate octaprenyltransferase [Anaerolineales bacterium]|nr:1,4-dihydroxy-2-naphthoate octaprenyltransferase [Anaerolineales bacterium]
MGARPKTLPAAIAPVLVGVAIAWSHDNLRIGVTVLAALCSVLIQIGTNLINDVGDYQKGGDRGERLGPPRVTALGYLTPNEVWSGVAVVFGLAAIAGLGIALLTDWFVLLVGVACLSAGYLYTSGPFPLSDNGLAGLFVMVFFGFVAVCGTVYINLGRIPSEAWWSGAAVGALVTNILVVNNIRDLKGDLESGRKNMPVWFGRMGGEIEYWLMLALAFVVPVILMVSMKLNLGGGIVFLSVPEAMRVAFELHRLEGKALNQVLASTSRFAFLYSILLSLAFLIS